MNNSIVRLAELVIENQKSLKIVLPKAREEMIKCANEILATRRLEESRLTRPTAPGIYRLADDGHFQKID